jgi:tellurite resistance protein TerC
MALASLLSFIHWFRFIFGALLIYSGIQAAQDDDDLDISEMFVVRMLKKCLNGRLVERYDLEEHRMFILEDGELRATLLVPVIFCLEATDILFAIDSVSAKVAQIPDYYIAYSLSVLALFGLRAMFFIINDLVDLFDMLKYGLCFILVFIGIELMVADWVQLPAQAVFVVVLSVFIVCTAGSTVKKLYSQTCENSEKCEKAPEASPDSSSTSPGSSSSSE